MEVDPTDGRPDASPVKSKRDTPAWRAFRVTAAIFAGTLLIVVAVLGVSWGVRVEASGLVSGGVLLAVSTGLLFVALLGAFHAVREARRPEVGPRLLGVLGFAASLVVTLGTAYGVFLAWWVMVAGFRRGRQLRHRGRVLLPPVMRGGAWAGDALDCDAVGTDRDALAAQWRENGRTEHASVAAFAHLSIELMALGAPPALVRAAHEDALEEIRHTELCFALARSLDGRDLGPGAFPAAARVPAARGPREMRLARLAVDSLFDGALHEGVSARAVARLVGRCEVPAIERILREIAADEGRHAAHGWQVFVWCVDSGGPFVQGAVRGALRTFPEHMRVPPPGPAAAGAWESCGIPGAEMEADAYRRTLVNLRGRVDALFARRACHA